MPTLAYVTVIVFKIIHDELLLRKRYAFNAFSEKHSKFRINVFFTDIGIIGIKRFVWKSVDTRV